MASFVYTGDPNAHKLTDESVVGVPEITAGKQFIVAQANIKIGELEAFQRRCAFWKDEGLNVPI